MIFSKRTMKWKVHSRGLNSRPPSQQRGPPTAHPQPRCPGKPLSDCAPRPSAPVRPPVEPAACTGREGRRSRHKPWTGVQGASGLRTRRHRRRGRVWTGAGEALWLGAGQGARRPPRADRATPPAWRPCQDRLPPPPPRTHGQGAAGSAALGVSLRFAAGQHSVLFPAASSPFSPRSTDSTSALDRAPCPRGPAG